MTAPRVLVADVGGTNTRVALADGPALVDGTVRRYRNRENAGIAEVIRRFLDEEGSPEVDGASVAIAGPVRDGAGRLTNLDWGIDRETLEEVTGAGTAAVLNDLQAQGHALGHIPAANLRSVVGGAEAGAHAVRLVIGVGTGFNAAPVFDTGEVRLVAPSESGHVNLTVVTDEDAALADWLRRKRGFADVEELLSGRGLEHAYGFAAEARGAATEAPSAADIMAACEAEGSDPVAEEAVRIFVRQLGLTAGNLALVFLPFGGVFLAGGVARAMAPHLAAHGFAAAFRDKGRFSDFLEAFPVTVVEDDYAALTGQAAHLTRLLGR